MRRLVAATLAALMLLTLVGCGGGGEEQAADTGATEQSAQPAPAPAPAPTGGTIAVADIDRSALSTETFEPFTIEGELPPAVATRLQTKQAMLLFFYNNELEVTDDLRDEIDRVVDDNRGNIDLLTYDLSKHTDLNEDGSVKIDTAKLQGDPRGQQAVRFAREVGVDHVPYILIIDDQGYKIFWSRGFIDAELLERQVQRAAR